MLLAIALVATGVTLANWLIQSENQRRAARSLRARYSDVGIYYAESNLPSSIRTWLKTKLPEDYVDPVIRVRFGAQIDDIVESRDVTNDDLRLTANFRSLREFFLDEIHLEHLDADVFADFERLEVLRLVDVHFDGNFGLAISQLRNLRHLMISHYHLKNSDCLLDLRNLKRLEYFEIRCRILTREIVEIFSQINSVTCLKLEADQLEPGGLAKFANHPNLTSLSIKLREPIHQNDLKSLAKLQSLKSLVLDCPLTDAEKTFLTNSLPGCNITWQASF
ncbi:MAG: hypothetical protein ABL888_10200 [Pirellulaceae bacterium]